LEDKQISESDQISLELLTTGDQIKRLRKHLKLTQSEFGDILGVSKICVARWEINERQCKGTALVLMNILSKYNLWESEINGRQNNF